MRFLRAAAVFGMSIGLMAEEYRLAPSPENTMELFVDKTGLLRGKQHRFTLDDFTGVLVYEKSRPEQARVELDMAAGSLQCRDTWLSPKDLTKVQTFTRDEFLEVSKYPRLQFVSTAVKPEGERFRMEGVLTVRDIEQAVSVIVGMTQGADGRMQFRGESVFKMSGFKLKPPSAALGAIGTKDDMKLAFQLTAMPR